MKNFKFLLILLSFVLFVEAQELDEQYLESLPEDIKADLIERADEQKDKTKENYRASLYSSRVQ